jgi:YgiT-type zinc finger domain-containing protein
MSNSSAKPYPRFCAECGQERVAPTRIVYSAEMKHDGKVHHFVVDDLPIDQCENCHEQWFTSETDEAIQAGLRTHLCLLGPADIRQRLTELQMSQSAFANRIGVAPETVSRWLNGHAVQNRAMDNLIRLFLGIESVRSVLTEHGPVEGLGVVERPVPSTMEWVTSRSFSVQTTKRRQSFQLRIQTDELYVR